MHVVISSIICLDVVVVIAVCGACGVFVGYCYIVATFQITRRVVTQVLSLKKQMNLVERGSLGVVALPTLIHLR